MCIRDRGTVDDEAEGECLVDEGFSGNSEFDTGHEAAATDLSLIHISEPTRPY